MITTTSSSVQSFFFRATASSEIYTLSLHDALPICIREGRAVRVGRIVGAGVRDRNVVEDVGRRSADILNNRSEEHTSELQSQSNLVCRLLLEKKKTSRTGY